MVKTQEKPLTLEKSEVITKQNSPVGVNQARVFGKQGFPCYIPEKVNLDKLTEVYPPNFKFQNDEAIYILHQITAIRFHKKKSKSGHYKWQKKNYPFTFLNAQLLQKRVRNYNKYLEYFVKIGVLETDGFYIPNEKSLGYKFSVNYLSPVKECYITKKTLLKSISKYFHLDFSESKVVLINNDISEYGHLTKWFDSKLSIDYSNAMNYIHNQLLAETEQIGYSAAINRYNLKKIGILKIHKSSFLNKIDTTAGRMHTVLTQIKSDLRQFIRYDGQHLVAVDIKNSQPYLSLAFLNPDLIIKYGLVDSIKLYNKDFDESILFSFWLYYDSKNVQEYIQLVSKGQLYERFIDYMHEIGELDLVDDRATLRKAVKTRVIEAIYSQNSSIGYKKYMKAFKDLFPDVYNIFNEIKKGKKRAHRALACSLQNFEAKLVLDNATKKIACEYPNLPIYTIHDSIVTTKGNEGKVHKVLTEVLFEAIGFKPVLSVESWSA